MRGELHQTRLWLTVYQWVEKGQSPWKSNLDRSSCVRQGLVLSRVTMQIKFKNNNTKKQDIIWAVVQWGTCLCTYQDVYIFSFTIFQSVLLLFRNFQEKCYKWRHRCPSDKHKTKQGKIKQNKTKELLHLSNQTVSYMLCLGRSEGLSRLAGWHIPSMPASLLNYFCWWCNNQGLPISLSKLYWGQNMGYFTLMLLSICHGLKSSYLSAISY